MDPYRPRRRVIIGRGPGVAPLAPRVLETPTRATVGVCEFCGERHPAGVHPEVDPPVDVAEVDDDGWVPPIEQTIADMEAMPINAVDLVEWINTPERARLAADAEAQREKPRKTVAARIEQVLGGER